jgi:hypothetical protein
MGENHMKVRLIGFLSGFVAGAAVLVLVTTYFGGSLQAQGINRTAPKAWGPQPPVDLPNLLS